jgi:hypothetical protein
MRRDYRKACCFRLFFDDELNLRLAENAIQRAKLAKDSDFFFRGDGKGTQAFGAGDYIIIPIPRHPDRCSVHFYCWTQWSVTQQFCNLCQQIFQPKWFGKKGICDDAKRYSNGFFTLRTLRYASCVMQVDFNEHRCLAAGEGFS